MQVLFCMHTIIVGHCLTAGGNIELLNYYMTNESQQLHHLLVVSTLCHSHQYKFFVTIDDQLLIHKSYSSDISIVYDINIVSRSVQP